MTEKPFSQACENNKDPILRELREVFAQVNHVLELASGTGQHACYFAEGLPQVMWQPTDLAENIGGAKLWTGDYSGNNLAVPLALDVRNSNWPVVIQDAIFTANSLHIMAWSAVELLFAHLANCSPVGNVLVIYGPFNYNGDYTSESNARFDQWLAQQHPDSAIRDFEAVAAVAADAGYVLHADRGMPANNRLLVWKKAG